MKLSYLAPVALALTASSFAVNPITPKVLAASAVSQPNTPTLAATQERVLEKGNRPDTKTLVAVNVSLGRGIYLRYNRGETQYIAYSGWNTLDNTLDRMMCFLIPNPKAKAVCVGMLTEVQGQIKQTAARAYEDGKCLLVVANYAGIVYRWEPYSGRSCR
jgi:hypothetical protein